MSANDDLEQLRKKLGVAAGKGEHGKFGKGGVAATAVGRPAMKAGAAGPPPVPSLPAEDSEDGLGEKTLEISVSEVELVSEVSQPRFVVAEQLPPARTAAPPPSPATPAERPAPPAEHARPVVSPSRRAGQESGREAPPPPPTASAVAPAADLQLQPDWLAEQQFFLREADSLVRQQPERAALMWIEAARAGLGAAEGQAQAALPLLEQARQHAGDNPQVLQLLRRKMLELHRYEEMLELTERYVTLGGEVAPRVAALLEAAAYVWIKAGQGKPALELLQRALELKPGHALTLALRLALQLELGQDQEVAEGFEQLAEVLNAPLERALCFYAAGTVRELKLGQLELAERDYARAVEADAEHLPALWALADLHEQLNSWPQLCEDLEQLAELMPSSPGRARLLLRAGSLHLDRTGNLELAATDLASAAATAPEDPAALSRLAYVYEMTGRHNELVGALRELLRLTYDAPGQAALLTRIGWLLKERLGALEDAMVAYQQALERQPGYLPALQSLGSIYQQLGRYDELLDILRPEMEGPFPEERRALRSVEIAEILDRRLDRREEAAAAYQRALELQPGLPLAFWPLRSLYIRRGDNAGLAELLSQQLEREGDPRTRHHLLLELARLQAHPLGHPAQAIETLVAARGQGHLPRGAGSRSAALELLELYEATHQYAELAELLLVDARDTADPSEARARRMQAAAVLDDKLDEVNRALEIYRSILQEDAKDAAAVRAAGRVLNRLGRWRDLIALHQQEIQAEPGRPDLADLWCRIGRLYHEALGELGEAVDAYKQGLQAAPDSAVALNSLEQLLRTGGRYEELVELLEQYADHCSDPLSAADMLCRGAELADVRLALPGKARELYLKASQKSPAFLAALSGQLSLHLRQQRYPQAAETLQKMVEHAADPLERSTLELQLARLQEFRLGELPDLELYGRVTGDPLLGPRLRAELLRVHRQQRSALLCDVLVQTSARSYDSTLAAAALLECALRWELGEGDAADRLEVAVTAYQRYSEDPALLWCVQRALKDNGRPAELCELLLEEASRQVDPAGRLALLGEATFVQLEAGDAPRAVNLAHQCLAIEPSYLPALRLLAQAAAAEGRWAELAGWQERLVQACQDRQNRLTAALAACDLWAQRVGDNRRALESLQPILREQPGQEEAFARAERLLQSAGEHEELSQLYSRRIKSSADKTQKIELLWTHARLLRQELGDAERAITEINQLLQLAPEDQQALGELAELLIQQARWSDAVATLAKLSQRERDLARRQQLRLKHAVIQLEQLHQPKAAREVLQGALQEQPESFEVKKLLVQVASAEGDWQQARQLLEQLAAADAPELQVWAMSQLAEVARVGLRDEGLRRSCERQALLVAGADPALLAGVIARFKEQDALLRLVEIGAEVVERAERPQLARTLQLALARVLLEELDRPAEATVYLESVLGLDAADPAANLLSAKVLERQGEVEGAAAKYRQIAQAGAVNLEALRGLSRLMSVLGHPDLAAACGSLVLLLEAEQQGTGYRPPVTAPGITPPGQLQVLELPTGLPDPPAVRALREALALIAPHLGALYPLELQNPLRPSHSVAATARQLALCVGLAGVKVSLEGNLGATSGVGDPVPLQIGSRIAGQPQSPAFRFWVGRALARVATGSILVERLTTDALAELVEALRDAHPVSPTLQQLRKQLLKALPRRARKQLELLELPRVTQDLWIQLREAERRRADQLGLLLSGDPGSAIHELTTADRFESLAEDPYLQELMRFCLSESYERSYRTLWSERRMS